MRRLLLALVAGMLLLTGCSLAQTAPDTVAIRYSGGDVVAEAEVFKQCYGPGASEYGAPGDKVYYYPAGQRTLKFSADPGSDLGPLTVTAQGGVQLTVAGTITFTPQFQNCDTLKDFHERIGRKYGAYVKGEDDEATTVVESLAGWQEMIATYVKDPAERAIDNASLSYSWDKLTNDPATKAAWEKAALEGIPLVMQQQSGGEFFQVDSVILQAPQMPQALQEGLQAQIKAEQQGAAAAAAQTAANSCDAACQQYQQTQALIKAIESGNVPVIPVPVGSPIQVGVPAPAPR